MRGASSRLLFFSWGDELNPGTGVVDSTQTQKRSAAMFQPADDKFRQQALEKQAGYVAGLGRGAVGFTTGMETGGARLATTKEVTNLRVSKDLQQATPNLGAPKKDFGPAPSNYVAGAGRGASGFGRGGSLGNGIVEQAEIQKAMQAIMKRKLEEGDDDGNYDDANYDEFSGFGGSLFNTNMPYEDDDREADEIYEAVDDYMDRRRRAKREAKAAEESERQRKEKPKIQQQFADLKRGLAQLSDSDWANIPEVGDHRPRKKTFEKYTPAPDSLLEAARQENERVTALDPRALRSGLETPGLQTPAGLATPMADLTAVGEGRGTVLSLKLDKMSDSVTGQTVVDPKGYLTDLNSLKVTSDADIGDIKKARLLLKSVTSTNPKHGPGWIAAARLEEIAGKIATARTIMAQGCTACPESEDVWLEAARLQTPEQARAVIAQAVKKIPQSVKIWLAAADLEPELKVKKAVLRKALEFIPNSVRLWKAAVELEEAADARVMLARAVECCPLSVDLWLALARLESYENARKVLNMARENIPTEPAIWITAAKLEEANGNDAMVQKIIDRAVKSLQAHSVALDREGWLKEAEAAEQAGHVAVCQAIVRAALPLGVEEADRKKTWVDNAEACLARGNVETARAIYAHALTVLPGKKGLWRRAAMLEKKHGTPESVEATLKKGTQYCPKAVVLWLMAAKEKWVTQGNVPGAREILMAAFEANPSSEAIWLAAVKLENENNEPQRARLLLQKARNDCPTKRVWVKSAKLEKQLGNAGEQRRLLEEALKKFPDEAKFYKLSADLEAAEGAPEKARELFAAGHKACPTAVKLWLASAALEEHSGSVAKARAVLEKARIKNGTAPQLWLAQIRLEAGPAANKKAALAVLAKALQECPSAGILWAEAIGLEERPQKKARSVDALKRCENDPHVVLAVAKLFWSDRKIDKARSWFNRAVTLGPDLGDAWATYLKFETQHGTPEQQAEVVRKCVEKEPRHGEKWESVRKQVENWRLTTEQILRKVVTLIPAC
eukprot:tig00000880_g5175.t1